MLCNFAGQVEGQWVADWHGDQPASQQIDVISPSGATWPFEVHPAISMSAGLRERHPAIAAWEGRSIQQPDMRIYAVAQGGQLRGFVTSDDADGLDVIHRFGHSEPHSAVTPSLCDAVASMAQEPQTLPSPLTAGTPVQRRVLRLALACTGEYAAFHGGTVESALAAMVEAVNRANAVFGPEVGVQFELVPQNGDLVFVDPQTDPFSNVNAVQMLGQNQSLLTAVLGPDGYDIGHVFGTGTSSIAALASACGTTKARGVSRSNTPTGEAFEVGQFCHELGHQLGANHTHSNTLCNAHAPTAFEPGSGSTIMGYAGLCSPNLQPTPDDEFHGHSLHEIQSFFANPSGNGALCPAPAGEQNHPPELHLPQLVQPIPPSTPFNLHASGAIDIDFDALTYSWEQRNAGNTRFRSFPPSPSPTRTCPSDAGTGGLGDNFAESLPDPGASMTFLCTVRDNQPDCGGVAIDTAEVYVPAGAEPFAITSWTWSTSTDTTLIQWNPGTTNQPPFNDSWLQAWLSNDGGNSYTIPLADSIPNTGVAALPWPAALNGVAYRLRLSPKDGIYFAISPDELDASANPAPPVGLDLAVVMVHGLEGDTLCGYAIAPQAVVHNFGTIAANGFQLVMEDLTSGDVRLHECTEMLAPGQSVQTGLGFSPDDWWAIGYGPHDISIHAAPLEGAPSDANPSNNTLQTSIYMHCSETCPGCGCTSPAACNYNGNAIFPDAADCELPGPGGCPCQSDLTASAILGGGEATTVAFADMGGTPNAIFVAVDFDNGGSAGSLAADLACSLCAPSGNCITVGGYNATLPGVNVGPWPSSWMSLTSGSYTAMLPWPSSLETEGDGAWSLTIMNGWMASGDVGFGVALEVDGLCSPLGAGIGCPGDLNADGVVNVSDLLTLLGAMGCAWDCLATDLTGDGQVNVSDVLGFLSNLGDNCP